MKLEVGQFARLKSGYIVKVLNVKEDWIETDTKFITRTFPKDFVKASYNIIDVLEVGDYVNGLRVHGITEFGLEVYMFGDCKETLHENEIKSIVTHEQMEQMAYKVGE